MGRAQREEFVSGGATVDYDLEDVVTAAVVRGANVGGTVQDAAGFKVSASGQLDPDDGNPHYFGLIQALNGAQVISHRKADGRVVEHRITTGGWRNDAGSNGGLPWYSGAAHLQLTGNIQSVEIDDSPGIAREADDVGMDIQGVDNFEWWLVHSATPNPNGAVDVLQSGTIALDWGAGTVVAGGGAAGAPRAMAGPRANPTVAASLVVVNHPAPAAAPAAGPAAPAAAPAAAGGGAGGSGGGSGTP